MKATECAQFLRGFGWERVTGQYGPATDRLGPVIYATYRKTEEDAASWYDALDSCADASGSGWGWVGAMRVVSEVGPTGFADDPRYASVVENGLAFLRSRNIPAMYLTGNEIHIWARTHEGQSWSTPIPDRRPPDHTAIRPLAPGEERKIAVLAGLGNTFKVRLADDGHYVAYLYRVVSDDNPVVARDEEPSQEAATLGGLYEAVAANVGYPTVWFDAELGPFFPLPAPDFSR